MKMKIDAEQFRVSPMQDVALGDRPTRVKSFCKSKHQYKKMLEHHVALRAAAGFPGHG
jgi:hypothetical protein